VPCDKKAKFAGVRGIWRRSPRLGGRDALLLTVKMVKMIKDIGNPPVRSQTGTKSLPNRPRDPSFLQKCRLAIPQKKSSSDPGKKKEITSPGKTEKEERNQEKRETGRSEP